MTYSYLDQGILKPQDFGLDAFKGTCMDCGKPMERDSIQMPCPGCGDEKDPWRCKDCFTIWFRSRTPVDSRIMFPSLGELLKWDQVPRGTCMNCLDLMIAHSEVTRPSCSRNLIVGYPELITVDIVSNCLSMLNIRQIVCCPTKEDAKELHTKFYDRLNGEFCARHMITRYVSAPYCEIVLNTGTRVRTFGMNHVGLCGQDADCIYVYKTEEIDPRQITDAIIPMLQTTPDTRISFFFTHKTGPIWDTLSQNQHYKIHIFEEETDPDAGMITNPFTGRKSWL